MQNQTTRISLKLWHKVMLHVLYSSTWKITNLNDTILPRQTFFTDTIYNGVADNYCSACVFFSVWFVGWGWEWAQYFKPSVRSLFSTQLNICVEVFFSKIFTNLKPLSIFAKKLHCDVWPGSKYTSLSSH